MIIVMGTVRMDPADIDRLSDAMATQMAATMAEDGCELYAFSRNVTDPGLLHISEHWRDNDALTAHFKAPHMATFNAAIATANVTAMSIKAYEAGNVRTLMGE
jgi:quinol monooxygenase YgiN